MIYGPVAEAAHGGKSNPTFDLVVGCVVLAISWFRMWDKEKRSKTKLGVLFGITAICFVFIISGVVSLTH